MEKQPKPKSPRDRAIRLLTTRDRTIEELRQRLLKEGFSQQEVEEVIVWCSEIGYLDDQRTAKQWVDNRNRFRPTGKHGLRMELRNKGVHEDTITKVMNSQEGDYQLAKELAKKRLATLGHIPVRKQYQRIGGLLSRRGFNWDVISQVLNELFTSSLDTDL